MVLRERAAGRVRVVLEARPYLKAWQPALTPQQIATLPPYMVIVLTGGVPVARIPFASFDAADGAFIAEATSRLGVAPRRRIQEVLQP